MKASRDWLLVCLLATAGLQSCAEQAVGETLRISPVVDGYVYDHWHDGTFNSVHSEDTYLWLCNSIATPQLMWAVIEFGLGSMPAGAMISSVSFEFSVMDLDPSSKDIVIRGYKGDGTLTLGDGNSTASVLGAVVASKVRYGRQSFPIAPGLLQDREYLGLRLTADPFANVKFYSSESIGLPAQGPLLVVTYQVPEPWSAVLGVIGTAVVVAVRLCRNHASPAKKR